MTSLFERTLLLSALAQAPRAYRVGSALAVPVQPLSPFWHPFSCPDPAVHTCAGICPSAPAADFQRLLPFAISSQPPRSP